MKGVSDLGYTLRHWMRRYKREIFGWNSTYQIHSRSSIGKLGNEWNLSNPREYDVTESKESLDSTIAEGGGGRSILADVSRLKRS